MRHGGGYGILPASNLAGCHKSILVMKKHRADGDGDGLRRTCRLFKKSRPARPQQVKGRGVHSGAYGATNKEHQVCVRRRVVRRLGPR